MFHTFARKTRVTNIGVKSTLSHLLLQGIIEFEMNENQHKTPEKNLKAVLTNNLLDDIIEHQMKIQPWNIRTA